MWLVPLAESTAACGGKALGLARLLAAGLPVPEGWVLADRAFRAAAGAGGGGEGALALDDIGHALGALAARIEAAELPADLVAEVDARAQELERLAVRSSATIEDGEAGAAAGVYSSRVAVPAALVWPAVRAVWASALTPLAVSYARTRADSAEGGAAHAIAAILQRHVDGARATIYTRPPGAPARDEVWIQRGDGGGIEKLPRDPSGGAESASVAGGAESASIASGAEAASVAAGAESASVASGAESASVASGAESASVASGAESASVAGGAEPGRVRTGADARALVELALRAERAIGARGGADVELVVDAGGRAWIVQARPIVHPVRQRQVPAPPMVIAPLVADGRRWTWDVAHNPDPLSVAQAALVERVDRAGIAPWAMRVCAGYLYTAPRDEVASAGGAPRPDVRSRDELDARTRALEARIEAALGDGGPGEPAAEPLELDAAIARYLSFYEIWAREVIPLIAAARAHRPAGSLLGARPSAIEAALLAAARGELDEAAVLARFSALAPAWDVAAPTFGERPALLRDAIARARLLGDRAAELPPGEPHARANADHRDDLARAGADLAERDDLARAGADLAERDDLWFARAQRLVRRALLARAAALGLPADDACWLPFDELSAAEADFSLDDARRRAAAARAAAARAARWTMPLVVGGDPSPTAGAPLRGIGVGGRATGRIKKMRSLASSVAVGRGDIVVARAVTPALAVFVTGCAALVSETGGVLDHGASLARELGIACVVGCRDAWSLLDDGMIATVDGDAGTVVVDES